MRCFDQCLHDFAFQAWHADIESGLQEVSAVRIAQINFGIDLQISRQFDFHFACGQAHRTDKAS